jgi:hypothetical protein
MTNRAITEQALHLSARERADLAHKLLESLEQIAYYEDKSPGLGARYHRSFQSAVAKVCNKPRRFPVFIQPDIRRVFLQEFPSA